MTSTPILTVTAAGRRRAGSHVAMRTCAHTSAAARVAAHQQQHAQWDIDLVFALDIQKVKRNIQRVLGFLGVLPRLLVGLPLVVVVDGRQDQVGSKVERDEQEGDEVQAEQPV